MNIPKKQWRIFDPLQQEWDKQKLTSSNFASTLLKITRGTIAKKQKTNSLCSTTQNPSISTGSGTVPEKNYGDLDKVADIAKLCSYIGQITEGFQKGTKSILVLQNYPEAFRLAREIKHQTMTRRQFVRQGTVNLMNKALYNGTKQEMFI